MGGVEEGKRERTVYNRRGWDIKKICKCKRKKLKVSSESRKTAASNASRFS